MKTMEETEVLMMMKEQLSLKRLMQQGGTVSPAAVAYWSMYTDQTSSSHRYNPGACYTMSHG